MSYSRQVFPLINFRVIGELDMNPVDISFDQFLVLIVD